MYLIALMMMFMLVPAAYSYPKGAPPGACDLMSPNHGVNVHAQTVPSPYTITVSPSTYVCGDTISVTLNGTAFKGFLCQARPNVNNYSTVGSLSDTDPSVIARNRCSGEGTSLTHSEPGNKSSFTFSWTHSGTTNGDVYIVCTVVQSKLVFWNKLTSSAITYSGTATTC
ncbi:putative ferric-chelate reductase 1 [Mercenaria mercenaria]|uniref:putative ferric-chelate reductase 1 n=1 Tax=Mercenaria mercenaria TaxID=6596 RepID=UPI001E1E22B4|nr:putative ferric-chelate reductase 1 [Mercenaria mercenaria]